MPATHAHRPKFGFFALEAQGGVLRIGFEKLKVFVRYLADFAAAARCSVAKILGK
jgi:hypothetical protein